MYSIFSGSNTQPEIIKYQHTVPEYTLTTAVHMKWKRLGRCQKRQAPIVFQQLVKTQGGTLK